MFKRLFVRDKIELSVLEEEAIRTPLKTILINLFHNKLAIIGIIGFVLILLFSFVGSQLFPVSRTYIELTNSSIRPGRKFLKYPKELNEKKIVKIVSGVSFSVALTDDGNLTVWGIECNRLMRNVSDLILEIPNDIKNANIVDIEAGSRFVICTDDRGNFYGWGLYSNGQTEMPAMIAQRFKYGGAKIVRMVAGTQWSAVLGDDGYLHVWGSQQSRINFLVPVEVEGRIVNMVASENNMILVLDDGSLCAIGMAGTEYYEQLPAVLSDGTVRAEKIVSTNRNVLVVDERGDVHLWGSIENKGNVLPDGINNGEVAYIDAGYKNFAVINTSGELFVWGANDLKQLEVPKNLSGFTKVFVDFFQFYAMDDEGTIVGAWGNKGYLWGSDQFGRDMFTRIIHGGRISLTVGAISVAISIVLAIIVGLSSGFFGGWVDHLLMRLTDIFESIPFFPIAITLSYVIGHRMEQINKLYVIMITIGVLGWMGLARMIRAQLLVEREKDFVLAARALGIKQRSIMVRHILPNVFNFVIIGITLGYASALLLEAGLSFLGFGVKEPDPSWGNMLTSAQESTVIQYFWWRWVIPALFVIGAALSINMLGDALREAMDPRSNER